MDTLNWMIIIVFKFRHYTVQAYMVKYTCMLNFINIYFLLLSYKLLSLENFLQQLRIIVRWCIQSQNPVYSCVNELFHHLEVYEPEIQRTKLLRIKFLIIYRLNVLLPIEIILIYCCRLKLEKLPRIKYRNRIINLVDKH